MNPANRNLSQEPGWDARVSVDTMIQAAPYAILRPGEVTLIVNDEGKTLNGVTLTGEGGLHYDADTSLAKDLAQKKIGAGDWSITQTWPACEAHLKD